MAETAEAGETAHGGRAEGFKRPSRLSVFQGLSGLSNFTAGKSGRWGSEAEGTERRVSKGFLE